MSAFITVLHILACFALVAIVLLQHGKGADIGAAFGGGASNTVFGGRGAGNFLTKLTTGTVVVFMLTSIVRSYFNAPRTVTDIIQDAPAAEAPLAPELETPESSFPEAAPIPEGSPEGSEAPPGFEAIPAPESSPAPEEGGSGPR